MDMDLDVKISNEPSVSVGPSQSQLPICKSLKKTTLHFLHIFYARTQASIYRH